MSIILPKVYKDNSKEQKYKHLNGKQKISYSQYSSWNSSEYRPDYIKQYMVGIKLPDGIFAQAGTDFGTMVEWMGTNKSFEKPKCLILDQVETEKIVELMEYPDNSIYEDYVVLDMGDFVIEGYADRVIYSKKDIVVQDFKTGNFKSALKYESDEYMQTNLYSYIKEKEGYNVTDCNVLLYERKGNGMKNSPIRLTGQYLNIPTPYDKDKTHRWLEENVRKTVNEISDYYKQYLKFFNV